MTSLFPNPKQSFAERLRFWRVRQNMTQEKAALQLNINRGYLSQVEGGRPPGRKLETRFNILANITPTSPLGNSSSLYGLRYLPLLSWTQAAQVVKPVEIPREWSEVVPDDAADERAFGVRLHGDSMEPKFSDGDIAILLPGANPTNGEIVMANVKNQGVFCKIMHAQSDKNRVTLSSYNPAYPPMEYRRDDFHWIFPVAKIIKQLRRK
jgi:repressor LexA